MGRNNLVRSIKMPCEQQQQQQRGQRERGPTAGNPSNLDKYLLYSICDRTQGEVVVVLLALEACSLPIYGNRSGFNGIYVNVLNRKM